MALEAFRSHALATNEIFLLAAKLVAKVICEARRELEERSWKTAVDASENAYLPFAVGCKAVWWEAIAVPDDVEDAAAFKADLKQLADDSRELLLAAVPQQMHTQFPAFTTHEDLYASLVGMFELNNLALYVPHPLLQVNEECADASTSSTEGSTATKHVELRERLSTALSVSRGCEGTGFYAVQSCINHSCCPCAWTAKGPGDADGAAVVRALRDIKCGEEITISYIDESQPYAARQEALRDYGFTCRCELCCLELRTQGLADTA